MTDLLNCLQVAFRGKKKWKQIKRKHRIYNSMALTLMPERNLDLNMCALAHMAPFLKRKYIKKAFVLTFQQEVADSEYEANNINIILCEETDVLDICMYYRFVQFMKYIVVISLQAPYGSEGLIRSKVLSMDEMMRCAIFSR